MEDVKGAYVIAFLSIAATIASYLAFDTFIISASTSRTLTIALYVITGVLVFTVVPSLWLHWRGKLQFAPE